MFPSKSKQMENILIKYRNTFYLFIEFLTHSTEIPQTVFRYFFTVGENSNIEDTTLLISCGKNPKKNFSNISNSLNALGKRDFRCLVTNQPELNHNNLCRTVMC